MEVDSFRDVSALITRYYKLSRVDKELPIPWTPLAQPVNQSRFALVTTGGLYHQGQEPPFDLERERQNPPWGDPSFRSLPTNMDPSEVGVSHFHINTSDVLADLNILLPVQRFQELSAEGRVGGLAKTAYSFMGYQGFPADLSGWKNIYGPQVADKMLAEQVECVFLSTA
jgi:D-proline reductase (dithiol) PrdB